MWRRFKVKKKGHGGRGRKKKRKRWEAFFFYMVVHRQGEENIELSWELICAPSVVHIHRESPAFHLLDLIILYLNT